LQAWEASTVKAFRRNVTGIKSFQRLWLLLRQAANGWLEDRAASMGAALAYYTALSVGPLLIIAIAIAALFFGRDAAQNAIIGEVQGLLGHAGGAAVRDILQSSGDIGSGTLALVVGVAALLLGATTSVVELQDDLDRIWKVEPRARSGIVNLLRSRLLSFGMAESTFSARPLPGSLPRSQSAAGCAAIYERPDSPSLETPCASEMEYTLCARFN
jgi:uncharacterized BrkB/YihY/UPF0761 family membrane protein